MNGADSATAAVLMAPCGQASAQVTNAELYLRGDKHLADATIASPGSPVVNDQRRRRHPRAAPRASPHRRPRTSRRRPDHPQSTPPP